MGCLDIRDARPGGDKTEISSADSSRCGSVTGPSWSVDDRKRISLGSKASQRFLDLKRVRDADNAGFGIGSAQAPIRDGGLGICVEQSHTLLVLYGSDRQADGKRRLAGAAFLGGEGNRSHRCGFPPQTSVQTESFDEIAAVSPRARSQRRVFLWDYRVAAYGGVGSTPPVHGFASM